VFCQKFKIKFIMVVIVSVMFVLFGGTSALADDSGRVAYRVVAGDTLATLAASAGVETDLLAAMNNMPVSTGLRQGQVLYLPKNPEITVTLAKGDTLWEIAQKYDVDPYLLMSYNNIVKPERLKVGEKILVPGVDIAEEYQAIPVMSASVSRGTATGSDSWRVPLKGTITSPFGKRGNGFHHGIDIAAKTGSKITTAKSGVVTFAGWKNAIYGYMVTVDHGNDFTSSYAHCSKVLVSVGQKVAAGTTLALVGETGDATGPHLHLELRKDGKIINPTLYIPLK